ncbi:MAG TPA: DUF6153 family protein [Streptosporangiaceae bacterium]|nr:DUF6153 family protein [Streptosporangiaceae bacterium]
MTLDEQGACPRPWLCGHMLLVLAVLAGLIGMHGLASMDPMAVGHEMSSVVRHAGAPQAAATAERHQDGTSPDGHSGHIGPVCLSAAVPGPPVMPALTACLPGDEAVPAVLLAAEGTIPAGGRGPPSLAELQLLRV